MVALEMLEEIWIPLVLFSAILYYQLQRSSVTSLVAMTLLLGAVALFYWIAKDNFPAYFTKPPINIYDFDSNGRDVAVSKNYDVKRFRKYKHIENNRDFQIIAILLRFVRIFDKARFADMLIHMEKLQKVYTYILGGRYDARQYIPTFIDMRQSILEIMYSFFLVVPQQLKHTYGVDTYQNLNMCISWFNVTTRKMLNVLYGYAKAQGLNMSDEYLQPYEPRRNNVLP